MGEKHYATCDWKPSEGYKSLTPYGEIKMFDDGGHRALEVMLLAVAACLNYYLVQYVQERKLSIRHIQVECNAETEMNPERVSKITTKVMIHGALSKQECKKMVTICERACKVANTLKYQPKIEVIIDHHEEQAASPRSRTGTR
jgi:uncharacterized OsmC-like protein